MKKVVFGAIIYALSMSDVSGCAAPLNDVNKVEKYKKQAMDIVLRYNYRFHGDLQRAKSIDEIGEVISIHYPEMEKSFLIHKGMLLALGAETKLFDSIVYSEKENLEKNFFLPAGICAYAKEVKQREVKSFRRQVEALQSMIGDGDACAYEYATFGEDVSDFCAKTERRFAQDKKQLEEILTKTGARSLEDSVLERKIWGGSEIYQVLRGSESPEAFAKAVFGCYAKMKKLFLLDKERLIIHAAKMASYSTIWDYAKNKLRENPELVRYLGGVVQNKVEEAKWQAGVVASRYGIEACKEKEAFEVFMALIERYAEMDKRFPKDEKELMMLAGGVFSRNGMEIDDWKALKKMPRLLDYVQVGDVDKLFGTFKERVFSAFEEEKARRDNAQTFREIVFMFCCGQTKGAKQDAQKLQSSEYLTTEQLESWLKSYGISEKERRQLRKIFKEAKARCDNALTFGGIVCMLRDGETEKAKQKAQELQSSKYLTSEQLESWLKSYWIGKDRKQLRELFNEALSFGLDQLFADNWAVK